MTNASAAGQWSRAGCPNEPLGLMEGRKMITLTQREFEALRRVLEEHNDADAGPRAEYFKDMAEDDPDYVEIAKQFDEDWNIVCEWLDRTAPKEAA
jgi:hypothetical protein